MDEDEIDMAAAGMAYTAVGQDEWLLSRTVEAHGGAVISCAVSVCGTVLATGSRDASVRLWDLPALTPRRTLEPGHRDGVIRVAFSANGQALASASKDTTVRIWAWRRGECVAVLAGHAAWVLGCAFSPDSRMLVSTSADRTVMMWFLVDLPLGDDRPAAPATAPATAAGQLAVVRGPDAGDFENAAAALAAADPDAGVPRLKHAGRINMSPPGLQDMDEGPHHWVFHCAFSGDGSLLAVCAGRLVFLWDAASFELRHMLTGHHNRVISCAFSPARRSSAPLLATASADLTTRVWNTVTGHCLHVLSGHTRCLNNCYFSNDGGMVVTCADDAICLFSDSATGRPLAALRNSERASAVWCCAFQPDGSTLYTACEDGRVHAWAVPVRLMPHLPKFLLLAAASVRSRRRSLPPELWHWIFSEFFFPLDD